MNKSSTFNARHPSLSKTTNGHAHCSRKMLLFSTPLLGRRGLNAPARRHGNDVVGLPGRCYFRHGTLERSFSLNAKTRLNVAASFGHVSSTCLRKSSRLIASSSPDPVARYNVRLSLCCCNTVHAVNFSREFVLENATSGPLKVLEKFLNFTTKI